MITGQLTIDGLDRGFLLRLPRVERDDLPLVLVLHGNAPDANGQQMREWTTFDDSADRLGWAVAYPNGHGGCWADGRGVTTADEAGVDDVAFLRAIVDWCAEHHGTVADRVVVAGMSNGAFMSHRFAMQASDRLAVLATMAGELPAALSEVQPTHAVSALLMHGTADRFSPIEGGYSRHRGPNGELRGRTLSLAETAARWQSIDRCPPGPGETRASELSSRTTVGGGVGGTTVAAWTLFGVGHSWPGAPSPSEPTTDEFDAAEEICRFAEPLLIPADDRKIHSGQ